MIPYNKNLTPTARELRKNMTKAEKHLWYDFLKRLPCSVHRQHNIGNYIVDFYIAEKKIVIEVDGRQHQAREHLQADRKRDEDLAGWDITVLRYSNESIQTEFRTVAQEILSALDLSFADLKPIK